MPLKRLSYFNQEITKIYVKKKRSHGIDPRTGRSVGCKKEIDRKF